MLVVPLLVSQFCNSVIGLATSSGSKKNGSKKPTSTCPYFYSFNIGCTLNCSDNNPSSNHPVLCELCQTSSIFWPNNMVAHYEQEHTGVKCPFIKTSTNILINKLN